MDKYRRQAIVLKSMAHPIRLQILDLLRREAECVCHLSAVLERPQPYMSQQLAVLRSAGVIVDEKDGTNVFYRLADEQVTRQVEAILGPPPADDRGGSRSRHQRVAGCNCPKCEPEAPRRAC